MATQIGPVIVYLEKSNNIQLQSFPVISLHFQSLLLTPSYSVVIPVTISSHPPVIFQSSSSLLPVTFSDNQITFNFSPFQAFPVTPSHSVVISSHFQSSSSQLLIQFQSPFSHSQATPRISSHFPLIFQSFSVTCNYAQ